MRDPSKTYTKIYGTRLRETDKAVHFTVCAVGTPQDTVDPKKDHWFPFSQVASSTTGLQDGEDMLEVADWILKQKELI